MSVLITRMKQGPGAAVHYFADRMKKGDARDPKELEPGTGAILEVKGKKLAVYKDEQGELHVMSPVCQHLRCIVGWNAEAKTWDCPCHGSRYDATGKVMNGPTKHDLLPETLD
jgi:Rieske Fe-S protein